MVARTKLLYISTSLASPPNGGKLLTTTNVAILKGNPTLEVSILTIGRTETGYYHINSTASTSETGLMNLLGYSGGLNKHALKCIMEFVVRQKPDIIYFDTSLYGRVAAEIKQRFKQIKIITFFQNIEFDFKWCYQSGFRRLIYVPAIISDWMNERWSVRYSDIIVALHEADSRRLKQLYNRSAEFIHQVCLQDSSDDKTENLNATPALPEKYFLFVGSAFLANIEALRFLVHKVMPALNEHLIVVGSNLERYRGEFSRRNVCVVGSVDDLTPYYRGATAVLAPIFTGAGMKVKVADALMHGKCVIGSSFSFIGYEKAIACGACIPCDSAEEFISAIIHFKASVQLQQVSRDIFVKEFSYAAGIDRMQAIIAKTIKL